MNENLKIKKSSIEDENKNEVQRQQIIDYIETHLPGRLTEKGKELINMSRKDRLAKKPILWLGTIVDEIEEFSEHYEKFELFLKKYKLI